MEAGLEESDNDEGTEDVMHNIQHGIAVQKWKPTTLALLFGGRKAATVKTPSRRGCVESRWSSAGRGLRFSIVRKASNDENDRLVIYSN